MKRKIIPSIFICLLLLLNSCKHNTDLASIGEISFSSYIQPIIAGNCTQSGCHNSQGDSKFSLVTYNDVISNGDIKEGDARGSKFYQVISNHSGENPMPPSPLPMRSSDQIKLVYIWIEQGAKNN